jgi:phosphoserine phosphatase RsbU/P
MPLRERAAPVVHARTGNVTATEPSITDRIAAFTARLFDVPVVIVSALDGDRVRFLAHYGTDVTHMFPAADPRFAAMLGHPLPAHVHDWPNVEDARNEVRLGAFRVRFSANALLVGVDGHILGTICIIGDAPRRIRRAEIRNLDELAALASDALEMQFANQRNHELELGLRAAEHEKRQVAEEMARVLQEVLLPPSLPVIPGIDVAARYLPASGGAKVVGDFYDVFQSSRDSWGIVIGDVCGIGVEAAKVALLARHAARAAAVREDTPSRILATLNHALLTRQTQHDDIAEAERFVTAVYVTLRSNGSAVNVVLCSAGHTPPLLRRANGEVSIVGQHGTVLGLVPNAELGLRDAHVRLEAGDSLLLYTDGVTDSRQGRDFYGDERLRTLFENTRGLDSAAVATLIENSVLRFSAGKLDDDTAILVVGVRRRLQS